MDVFLEQGRAAQERSVFDRIQVACPLNSMSADTLVDEASRLYDSRVRLVSVRRQQLLQIGRYALADVLADAGLEVACLSFSGGFTGLLKSSFNDAVRDVQRAICEASEIGARFLVVLPGGQGIHTYRHAERIIRDGLKLIEPCAREHVIRLLIPTSPALEHHRDFFRPKTCPLQWVRDLESVCVSPLLIVRGPSPRLKFPRGWRVALNEGGALRICHRCPCYPQNFRRTAAILRFLGRRADPKRFDRLSPDY
jgi:hypothetical protein